MTWIVLIAAGLLECAWAFALKLSEGFSKPLYTLLFLVFLAGSMGGLAYSQKSLPLSLAYPVWTGIGAAGSVIVGVLFLKDRLSAGAACFTVMLIISIIGLKLTSGH